MDARKMALEKVPHPIHLQYSFPPYPDAELKTIQVDLAEGALLLDAIRHCREEHSIPIYLESSLLSTVQEKIQSTRRTRVQQEIERVDREIFATPETTTTEQVKGDSETTAATAEDASRNDQVEAQAEATPDGCVQKLKLNATEAELLKAMIENYRNHTTEFYTQPEENMFPEAYHTLVHSPVSGLFDAILDLEREYASEVNALLSARDAEIDGIQAKHNLALQSENPQRGMTHMVTRHIERLEVAQATWNSQLDDLQTAQREKYQEFILELFTIYRRHQASSLKPTAGSSREETTNEGSSNGPEHLDGKAMVTLAMNNVGARKSNVEEAPANNRTEAEIDNTNKSLPQIPSDPAQDRPTEATDKNDETAGNSSQSEAVTPVPIGGAETTPVVEARPEPPRKEDVELNRMIQSILEMGFDEVQAKGALLIANRNMDHAINLLLEQPENIPRLVLARQKVEAMKENARQKSRAQSSPQRPLPSLTGSSGAPSGASSSSTAIAQPQPFQRGHTSNRSLDRSGSVSSPRPLIGFLQQQKNALLTNNSNPSVKKFGGWLNKAIENLGLDDDMDSSQRGSNANTVTPEPQQAQPVSNLAESFTVVLGSSHSKVTHNLRLVVSDPVEVFPSHRVRSDRDLAIQAQTAASLYGQNLSGLVQLVNVRDWAKYKSGQACHQEFFKSCQTSTELHFDSIEKQLEALEEDFPLDGSTLREGDFIMTRHSNLPMIHVVFHLFYGQSPTNGSSGENGESAPPSSSSHMPPFSQPGEFVLKHDFLAGLRNIIRTAHRYEITMLSIPFMMLPSSVETQMMSPSPYLSMGGPGNRLSQSAMSLASSSSTVVGSNMPSAASPSMSSSMSGTNSMIHSGTMTTTIYMTEQTRRELLKRTETLMRHWKACLMESARHVKQVGNQGSEAEKFRASQGGDVKVIQFMLPRTTNDDMFRTFRMLLVNIFGGS